jgi:catechol 2,3-dioxygenase-like lactoylglutathione lyase family enzyme
MNKTPITVNAIDHINMSVRDLARAIVFYRDVFGFEIREDRRDHPEMPHVIMGAGARAYLAIYADAQARAPEQAFINHWGFVVGELEPVRERLRDLGVDVHYAERNDGIIQWPHSRSLYVSDPDGHEIELVEVFGGGLH